MASAVIVDAIRTPLGRRNGRLKDWHPVDLAAATLQALVEQGVVEGPIEQRVRGEERSPDREPFGVGCGHQPATSVEPVELVAFRAAANAVRPTSISCASTISGGIHRSVVAYVPAFIRMTRPSVRQWA